MTAFAALLRVHLRGRGPLLAAALLLGFLPYLLPLLPSARSQSPAEVRAVATPVVAGLAIVLLALLVGAELLSRDLAERRMSFYLSRPVGTSMLFWARVLAAFLTLVAGAILVLAPVGLIDGLESPAEWPSIALLGVFGLPLVASTVAISLRSRSRFLGLDLAAVAVTSAVAYAAAARLRSEGAHGPLIAGLAGFAAAAAAAIVAGHLAALAQGRNDIAAARAALGRKLWTLLVPSAIALALYAGWTLSAGPASIDSVWDVRPSPTGPWLAVAGHLRGRLGFGAQFLWSPVSGKFLRLPGGSAEALASYLDVGADGTAAAWIERDGPELAVWRAELPPDGGTARPHKTSVALPYSPTRFSLSPAGRTLAAHALGRWLLYDLASGRLLAAREDDSYVLCVRWMAEDRARIFSLRGLDGSDPRAIAWDFSKDGWSTALDLGLSGPAVLQASPDGRRALVRDRDGWQLVGVGSDALAPVDIVRGPTAIADSRSRPLFLADGRILTRIRGGEHIRLALRDRDGSLLADADVGPGRHALVAGTIDPDHLWVVVTPNVTGNGSRLIEIEWPSGNVQANIGGEVAMRELGKRLLPASWDSWGSTASSGNSTRWLLDETFQLSYLRADGRLVRPLAGEPIDPPDPTR